MSTFKKIVRWTLSAILLAVLALAIFIGPMTYRALVGVKVFETTPPALPADLAVPAVLIFSKTNGFRHEAAIPAANAMFRDIARERGWSIFLTENAAVFNPEQLAKFKVVVWSNASGDALTPDQRKAFQTWLLGGGGFVGIHAAGDGSQKWPWYGENVIGAKFTSHIAWPGQTPATVRLDEPRHPAAVGLPDEWTHTDEWYSFASSVRSKGYRVIATVDEATYRPRGVLFNDIRMGKDHPVVWSHCVGKGRALYSALGHDDAAFADPRHKALLANGLAWAGMHAEADETCVAEPPTLP